jgi:hypothetical protein
MNLTPFAVGWAFLVLATIILMIYRAVIGGHEDESLHVLDGEARMVSAQQAMFKKLGAVERWTKIVLTVTIVYGLALGGAYLYHLWQQTT